MEKQVGKKVTEEVCSISSCLYNSLNMTRPILERWRVNKDNKFVIAGSEYHELVMLISSGKEYDNWRRGPNPPNKMQHGIINARYLYRDFLFKLVNTWKNKNETLDDKRVYIVVDDAEVGYISNNKIMGVNYPRCRYKAVNTCKNGLPAITLSDEVYEQVVVSTDGKNVIHLNPEWFLNETLEAALTPFQAYLACKAGDALVNLWLDVLVTLGCDRGTELMIRTESPVYLFLYTQVYNDWAEKILNVNHYELYPKMQFLEYELC